MSFKITAPLGNLYELPALLKAGADEVYCGLCLDDGGSVLADNRRGMPAHNLRSLEELEAAADFCHGSGRRLFLAVNDRYYPAEALPGILKTIEAAVDKGIDAVITASLELNYQLSGLFLPVDYHLSIMAAVLSRQNLSFWKNRNITRVILPRQLCIEEIVELTQADMEFEVLILNGACRFEEGLCGFEHLLPLYSPKFGLGGCSRVFKIETGTFQHAGPLPIPMEDFQERLNLRYGNSREETGPCTCGLCILPHLKETKVRSLKIVGREAPTAQKIKDIRFCRNAIGHFQQCASIEDFYKQVQEEYRQSYQKNCTGSNCYYITREPGYQ